MRVIAGDKKGRKLNPPKGDLVRPTPDKVKGAMFNIASPLIEGSTVLDLFAGSGALGIEALSRGAKKVYFGDFDKKSINLINKNLEHVGLAGNGEVILGDFKDIIKAIDEKIDIVLLDPPYYKGFYEEILLLLSDKGILNEDGMIIVERDKFQATPDISGNLHKTDTKKYGKTALDIYKID